MSERLTKKEIEKILSPVFKNYFNHYNAKLMTFSEFAIIDNLRLQILFALDESFKRESEHNGSD